MSLVLEECKVGTMEVVYIQVSLACIDDLYEI